MNVYIPFNMIVDTDFGVLRLVELVQNIEPYSTNKLKSFLINRKEVNPIIEYKSLRNFDIIDSAYEVIVDKHYQNVLQLSETTDMISFVINTYKLGMSNQVNIVIGCDDDIEINYLKAILKVKYSFNISLNKDIKLKDFDCIFIKYINYAYADYLINTEQLSAKRIYVADYNFNTLYDGKSKQKIIDPMIHIEFEQHGNILCLVSLYNRRNRRN